MTKDVWENARHVIKEYQIVGQEFEVGETKLGLTDNGEVVVKAGSPVYLGGTIPKVAKQDIVILDDWNC